MSTNTTTRTIELADEVRQANPIAYMVFTPKGEFDYQVFFDEHEARGVADSMAEDNDVEQWPIYPLWAGKAIEQ